VLGEGGFKRGGFAYPPWKNELIKLLELDVGEDVVEVGERFSADTEFQETEGGKVTEGKNACHHTS
jgi:hypothetical protein